MKLTTKYNLKEHGFVLVDNFYSNEEIESFKFVNSDFEYPFQDEEAKGAEIIFDFSKVKQYADRLTNKNYYIFMQKINYKPSFIGSHEIYHQDYFYRQNTNIESEEFLQVFIALEDLDYAPLNIFVGSHKKGLIPAGSATEQIHDDIKIKPTKGSLLLLHGHTWHRVYPVFNEIRVSTNFRCVPENTPDNVTDVAIYRNMLFRFSDGKIIAERN